MKGFKRKVRMLPHEHEQLRQRCARTKREEGAHPALVARTRGPDLAPCRWMPARKPGERGLSERWNQVEAILKALSSSRKILTRFGEGVGVVSCSSPDTA